MLEALLHRLALPALVSLLGLAACQSPSDQDAVAQARSQIQARDPAAAIVTLKDLLSRNPEHAEARRLLGQAFLAAGDASAAVQELRKAGAAGVGDDASRLQLLRALLAAGEARAAIGEFAAVELAQPRSRAEQHTLLAAAHAQLGDAEAAAQALRSAQEADASYAPARLMQARVDAANGQLNEALESVRQLLAVDPQSADAWHLQGELQRALPGGGPQARRSIAKALELQPRHLAALAANVAVHLEAGELDLAERASVALAGAWSGHPRTLELQTWLALRRGDRAKAEAAAQQLMRARPKDPMSFVLSAEVARRAGRPDQERAQLAQALSLAPASVGVRRLLAATQLRQGDATAAAQTVAPLVEAKAAVADDLMLAGQAHLALGETARAQADFQRAAKAAPSDPQLRTAVALSELDRNAAQLGGLKQLAASDTSGRAGLALVAAHLSRGEAAAALEALRPLEAAHPTNPLLPLTRGRIHQHAGRIEPARQAYDAALKLDPANLGALSALAELDFAAGRISASWDRLAPLVRGQGEAAARAGLVLADLQRRAGAATATVTATLEQAARQAPADPAPRVALVRHLLQLGKVREALAQAQALRADTDARPQSLEALALAQLAAGEAQQALSTVKRLQTLQPDRPGALVMEAQAHRSLGDLEAAARRIDQALAIDAGWMPALAMRFEMAAARRDWRQAEDLAVQTQRRYPRRPEGWIWSSHLLAAQQRPGPAAEAAKAALERAGRTDLAMRAHALLGQAGQAQQAQAVAERWVQAHPADLDFRMYLGDQAMLGGKAELAEAQYRLVLASSPQHVRALNNLAWAQLKRGDRAAVATAEQAHKLDPDQADPLDTWAQALAAAKQTGRALEIQKQAVERAPERADIRLNLARLAAQRGERKLAQDELRRLAALGPAFPRQAEVATLMESLR